MKSNKVVGIVGGMGSHATVDAFRNLVESTPALKDQDFIETIIHNNTRIPDRTRNILYDGESPLYELKRSVKMLNDCGADFIFFPCITSHYYLDDLIPFSKARIIDAVQETAMYIKTEYPKTSKAGVLATTGTLKTALFQDRLARAGIECVLLNDVDQEKYFMESVYADWGIKAGNIEGLPKARMLKAARKLIAGGADIIIAGCTEVPLVLKQEAIDVVLLNPIKVVLDFIISKCYE